MCEGLSAGEGVSWLKLMLPGATALGATCEPVLVRMLRVAWLRPYVLAAVACMRPAACRAAGECVLTSHAGVAAFHVE